MLYFKTFILSFCVSLEMKISFVVYKKHFIQTLQNREPSIRVKHLMIDSWIKLWSDPQISKVGLGKINVFWAY